MYKTFKLTAVPTLLREGDSKGCLGTITFVATSETETHSWWSVNTGNLADEFEQIVSPELATHILAKLEGGKTVEFPNRYELGEVRGKFGGRWGD